MITGVGIPLGLIIMQCGSLDVIVNVAAPFINQGGQLITCTRGPVRTGPVMLAGSDNTVIGPATPEQVALTQGMDSFTVNTATKPGVVTNDVIKTAQHIMAPATTTTTTTTNTIPAPPATTTKESPGSTSTGASSSPSTAVVAPSSDTAAAPASSGSTAPATKTEAHPSSGAMSLFGQQTAITIAVMMVPLLFALIA